MLRLLLRARPRTGGPRKPPRRYPRPVLAVFAAVFLACCVAALFRHDPAQAGTGDTFSNPPPPAVTCTSHGPGWIYIQQTAQFPARDQKRYGLVQVSSTMKCTGDDFTTVMTPNGHNFGIYSGWTWKP